MDAALRRFSPLSGLVFVVLYGAGILIAMKGSPEFVGRPDDIQAYYEGAKNHKIMLGGVLSVVATPFWFLFLGNLRSAMARAEGGAMRLTSTAFAAGAVAAATGATGILLNTVGAVRADKSGSIDPAAASVLYDASHVLAFTATMAILAAFALCVGVASLRYGAVVPKWLGVIFVILAVPMVVPPISWMVMPLGLLLTVVLSILLYVQKAGEL